MNKPLRRRQRTRRDNHANQDEHLNDALRILEFNVRSLLF